MDQNAGRRKVLLRDVVEPRYSVVAPVFEEEETLPHFYERVTAVMEGLGRPYELVLVNDGSGDGSYRIMRRLHEQEGARERSRRSVQEPQ